MEITAIEAFPLPAAYCDSDPDLPLIEAAISGDVSAYEKLVRQYSHLLLRVADQVTHNLEDAQEAVQESFLKAYQNLRQFRGNSKFSTWLTRIALNESIGILRKRRRCTIHEVSLDQKDPQSENLALQIADWHPNPEHLYGESELRSILREALLRLRPTLRVVFVLRDIEELSVVETAAILDLTPSTVKVRLHRARLQLRDILSRHFCKTTLRSRPPPKNEIPRVSNSRACE